MIYLIICTDKRKGREEDNLLEKDVTPIAAFTKRGDAIDFINRYYDKSECDNRWLELRKHNDELVEVECLEKFSDEKGVFTTKLEIREVSLDETYDDPYNYTFGRYTG